VGFNVNDLCSYVMLLEQKQKKGMGLKPDLCSAGAVLYQFSYQANWKLVII